MLNRSRYILRALLYKRVRSSAKTGIRVRVYLSANPAAMTTGQPWSAVLAYSYRIRMDRVDTDRVLLERVFAAFNDHPVHRVDHKHTRAWYAKRLRSLSVGDVVGIDDRHYVCQKFGWASIPAPSIDRTRRPTGPRGLYL
ncbi:hypothetical protein C5E45_20830 [Nocardia nova]|uniref:Uncharacterized protein n=1 Tax=Nocardia nova TaxID=37330 RepID=A0A2S6AML5_9NOCA|nr:hypothetical protein [Nocardia nova]PPJ36491.1 hypothetical protein C5E45_20830 [Nocardia nova]